MLIRRTHADVGWLSGWIYKFGIWDKFRTEDRDERVIGIWKKCNLTELDKANQEVSIDVMERAQTAEQFSVRGESRQESAKEAKREHPGGRRNPRECGSKSPEKNCSCTKELYLGSTL